MKVQANNKYELQAMTLVELLLVVFVVFILIALLLPVSAPNHPPAKKLRARIEMAGLVTAIEAYEADYNRLPLADYVTNEDITCGINSAEIQGFQKINGTRVVDTNSDLILILMDIDSGINAGHKFNPKQIKYLNAQLSGDTNSPGVGIDFQYRDPWGNPYVISLDADHDGLVRDSFYSNPALFPDGTQTSLTKTNGLYELPGKAMVWSRGADGKANMNIPANNGVNKDNIISWQ
jgi:type II secretory pathway pseudopilin PulG